MAFDLPPLPYAEDALEPHMSARTLQFHHGKHHKGYVTKLNKAIEGTEWDGKSLEDVIRGTAGDKAQVGIFNKAAQAWNHAFFWNCMKPGGGGAPEGELADRIKQAFGDLESFKSSFKETAGAQFGSGWAWLVLRGDDLEITRTANAVNPLSQGRTALLTCDVWEHAYYLDYQNRRGDFVQAFLDHLVNWSFVAETLSQASSS